MNGEFFPWTNSELSIDAFVVCRAEIRIVGSPDGPLMSPFTSKRKHFPWSDVRFHSEILVLTRFSFQILSVPCLNRILTIATISDAEFFPRAMEILGVYFTFVSGAQEFATVGFDDHESVYRNFRYWRWWWGLIGDESNGEFFPRADSELSINVVVVFSAPIRIVGGFDSPLGAFSYKRKGFPRSNVRFHLQIAVLTRISFHVPSMHCKNSILSISSI